ncbi:MAG: polymerase subunit delta [Actinomycetota bacterium]|jgi:DNA polymerase-3 subunit delta|nr:polymerase subunit delta [Actinomycetota bacterium]
MTAAAYLVRGDDAILLSEAVRNLVHELVGQGNEADAALAVEDLDLETGDDHSVGALMDACLTPPFFTDRRIVIGRNAGALNTDEASRVVQYLDDPLDTTTLILVGGGGAVPPKLVTAVKSKGELRDAALPRQSRERTTWLVDRIKHSGMKLDAAAGNRLGQHLGEDLSRLPGILEVLEAAYGKGATVTEDDLEPFLGEAGGAAPWDLTDALDRGDAAAALEHLHRQLEAGDRHPLVVMATLHRHYQAMLRLDGANVRTDAEAAQVLGLKGSTFPAKKAMSQARKLGSQKVRRAIALLAEADLDLRGAKAWPDELVMEILVARLCQLPRV